MIRNVLCAVSFNHHNHKTVSWAARIADKFGARLSLAHVTPGVESWGPGGTFVDPGLKETLSANASRSLAELQLAMGTNAEVFVGGGDVPTVLSQAATQIGADLLVTGSRPYGVRLRTHCYGIICAMQIPVLSV